MHTQLTVMNSFSIESEVDMIGQHSCMVHIWGRGGGGIEFSIATTFSENTKGTRRYAW